MRKVTWILGAVSATSCAVTLWLWSELREARGENAGLKSRLLDAEASPAGEAVPEPIPVGIRTASAAAPARVQPAASEGGATRQTTGASEDWDSMQRRLLQDPKYREARREELLLQYRGRRDDAMRLLGFTADEADALIVSLVDRQMHNQAAPMPVVDLTPEGRQQLRARNEAEQRAYQDEVRRLVGEDKRARWEYYWDSLQSRGRVDSLRAQLGGADALREDQVEPLISALNAEQQQMRKELSEFNDSLDWTDDSSGAVSEQTWERYSQRQVELMKATHVRALRSAGAILSTAQLKRLEAMFQRDVEREEAQARTIRIRNRMEAGKPAN